MLEILVHIGMRDRARDRIRHQILLADISDIIAVVAFGEQVVERLVAVGPDVFGDRLVPFVAIGEDGVDVEDHAAEVEHAVFHHVADGEAAFHAARGIDSATGLGGEILCSIHENRRYGVHRPAYNGRARPIPRNLVKRGLAMWGRSANRRALLRPGPWARSAPDRAERWQRGRMRCTRNAVYWQQYRGFESHPLRHGTFPISRSYRAPPHGVPRQPRPR